jgi:hypothetical protein
MCAVHSNVDHAAVHESGHALAAVRHNIPFHRLVVHQTPAPLPWEPESLAGGWVELDLEGALLLQPRPLLEFSLAGKAVEEAVLGDSLPGGEAADLLNWRRMVKAWEALDNDAFVQLVGEPLSSVVGRVRTWAIEVAGTVEALSVAAASAGRLSAEQIRRVARAD